MKNVITKRDYRIYIPLAKEIKRSPNITKGARNTAENFEAQR